MPLNPPLWSSKYLPFPSPIPILTIIILSISTAMEYYYYYYSSLVLTRILSRASLTFSLLLQYLLSLLPVTSSGEPNSTAASAAAKKAARERLPVAAYAEDASTTCAVCLSDVSKGDSVRELRNCRHVFHTCCLDRWLDHDDRISCPLCRAPLLTQQPCPSPEPSWAVERLLYLFGDDLLLASS